MNFVHLNHLRAALGIPPHPTGTWAMVLVWFPLLNALATYLWALYWNHSVDDLTDGSPGPLRSPATAAPS